VKKVISIVFAVCVLFSGVHLTVSTHYCGGMPVARTVSLTGKIASCGMEECANSCPFHGSQLKSTCCQNVVCMYSVDNHFTPATFFQLASYFDHLQIHSIITGDSVPYAADVKPTFKNEYPPGILLSTQVDLSDICVFRI
jgi:hypothetical protein